MIGLGISAEVAVHEVNAAGEPYPEALWQELRERLANLGARAFFTTESVYVTFDEAKQRREIPQVGYHIVLGSLKDFCPFIHEVEWIAEAFAQPNIQFGFGGTVDRLS